MVHTMHIYNMGNGGVKLKKRYINYIVLIVIILVVSCGYVFKVKEISELKESMQVSINPISEIKPQNIGTKKTDGFTLINRYESCNDKKQSVELYVNAEKGPDGEIIFDDGQEWIILFSDSNKEYVLFDERIQLGKIDAHIYEAEEDGVWKTRVMTILTATAGIKVIDYTINEDGTMNGNIMVNQEGINYQSELTYR